jgi:two-component system response regulator FixJ
MLNEAGYEVTCFANAASCLTELEDSGCHLLITDIKDSDMDGMKLLNKVKRISPWTPVLAISDSKDVSLAVRAIKLGASDFMEKPFNKITLINKVKEILSGSEFDSSSVSLKLTKTEKKILKLILDGYNNKEIAYKIGCATRTVEFHHSHIYHKFGVDNPVELTKKAMEMFTSQPQGLF